MWWSFPLMLAGALTAAPPAAVRQATHTVELSDPAGDVTRFEGNTTGDVTVLALRSDGALLTVAATLHEAPVGLGTYILEMSVDTDNTPGTGFRGGFEYEVELASCVDYGGGLAMCAGSVGKEPRGRFAIADVNKLKADGMDRVRSLSDASRTPIQGNVVAATLTYADLGVRSGQTIRIAAREKKAADAHRPFPEVALVLK